MTQQPDDYRAEAQREGRDYSQQEIERLLDDASSHLEIIRLLARELANTTREYAHVQQQADERSWLGNMFGAQENAEAEAYAAMHHATRDLTFQVDSVYQHATHSQHVDVSGLPDLLEREGIDFEALRTVQYFYELSQEERDDLWRQYGLSEEQLDELPLNVRQGYNFALGDQNFSVMSDDFLNELGELPKPLTNDLREAWQIPDEGPSR
ncbi:MAG: hypothetical protein CMM94_07515 [Rickettsiales bacterium]|nr:hypothetical protein [Rickettsiales bacterium]